MSKLTVIAHQRVDELTPYQYALGPLGLMLDCLEARPASAHARPNQGHVHASADWEKALVAQPNRTIHCCEGVTDHLQNHVFFWHLCIIDNGIGLAF